MKNKFFIVLLIMIFLLPAFNVVGTNQNVKYFDQISILKPSPDDEIDQKQNYDDGVYRCIYGSNVRLAQSFKPTLNIITRVQLRLKIQGSPDGLEISIRKDLNGEDLTSIYIKNEDLTEIPSGFWYEFDFPNAAIIPENTYYIVWTPHGATDTNNAYCWGIKDGNYYDRGEAWNCTSGEWSKLIWGPIGDPDFVFKTYGYLNSAPKKPTDLNGPSTGEIGENLYYESTFNDPDGNEMNVIFDWGDGTDTEWMPSVFNGIFGSSHAWYFNGTYQIKTKAKDNFFESPWSEPLTVFIGNIPPEKPEKPDGPLSGKILFSYTYSTSTIDLNGDEIFYLFDWGDETSGWLGPYDSGDNCETNHIWDNEGDYEIKVKAKDNYGDESPWSDPLTISMPKKKSFNFIPKIFLWLLEIFPFLQPFLNFL